MEQHAYAKTIICIMCKFLAHGDACPEDTDRAALLSVAVAKGLRACYRCGARMSISSSQTMRMSAVDYHILATRKGTTLSP